MANVVKVRRLANPFKSRRAKNARTRARRRNRKMTRAQIKYFGSKRQKAALKRRRRVSVVKSNPARRRRTATTPKRRRNTVRRTRRNPALVVTLGALNPRRQSMAKRRRRNRKPATHHRRRRRSTVALANPVRHYRHRRRASNPHRRRRVHVARRLNRRRNPGSVFGTKPFSGEGLKLVVGGLAGVAAAKFIPRLIPTSLTGSLGSFGTLVTTAASAFIAGWAAEKFLGEKIGSAVMFGGLMQTGSVALTMVAPGFQIGGVPIALSGMGDLLPGQFVVPQNPLRIPPPPPVQPSARANVTMSGLARAFGSAF